MKQTILITGASSGVGLLIANRLHESGSEFTSKIPRYLTFLGLKDIQIHKQYFSE